jgi:hypothetical protein
LWATILVSGWVENSASRCWKNGVISLASMRESGCWVDICSPDTGDQSCSLGASLRCSARLPRCLPAPTISSPGGSSYSTPWAASPGRHFRIGRLPARREYTSHRGPGGLGNADVSTRRSIGAVALLQAPREGPSAQSGTREGEVRTTLKTTTRCAPIASARNYFPKVHSSRSIMSASPQH